MASEDDDDLCFEAGLFVDEDYVESSYEIAGETQTLLCSEAASVIWPVSVFLSWFIASRAEELRGRVVVEVGAGCGLAGLVAARTAATVALTDGNEYVIKLLAQNEAYAAGAFAHPLLWGSEESWLALQARLPAPVDVVVGADVVCWPLAVLPLLRTVKAMLLPARRAGGEPRFYCGFVCRATSVEALLAEHAADMGFVLTELPADSFLPDPRPENVASGRELQLFELRLAGPNSAEEVEWGELPPSEAC